MKQATEAPPALHHPPAPGTIPGHDELNFAEFPLVVLADRPPKGVKTIHYQDEYQDPKTGRIIPRKVTITGSDEHGLPTAKDDEVIVGMLYLTKLANSFADPNVHFSRRSFLQILNWPDEGKYYKRLTESLYRWLGVTIRYEDCWWDNQKKRYGTEAFHLLDNVSIYDERTRPRQEESGQLYLPLSSFKWNAIPFKSFHHDYMKGLDIELFLRLPGAAAKRAYRYLDKTLPHGEELSYDLRLFACEKVGMSRNYKPSRLITEVQSTVVTPLEHAEFIAPMDPRSRFVKQGRGRYQVLFSRNPVMVVPSPPTAAANEPAAEPELSPLVAELCRRKLGGKLARDLVAAYPADYLQRKIDYFDYQLETGSLKKPAAWLRRAIEQDYGEPDGYQPREELERQRRTAEEKQRQSDDARRREHEQRAAQRRQDEQERAARAARYAHIAAYLKTLTPQERQALEQQSLANARDPKLRDAADPSSPSHDVALRLLVDDEVLRLHPLPEPMPAS